jgi:hypothetical protein
MTTIILPVAQILAQAMTDTESLEVLGGLLANFSQVAREIHADVQRLCERARREWTQSQKRERCPGRVPPIPPTSRHDLESEEVVLIKN